MHWYIFFVRTGKEYKIERFLKERLDTDIFIPFLPMLETLFKISGRVKKEMGLLFPSYVFVESEVTGLEFVKRTNRIVSASNDIIRLLSYGGTGEIAMREHEKRMLLSLCNDDHCIESSSGIISGSCVYIKEGPLMGLESIIKRIDRHRRQAIINLDIMGAVRQISVALDILEKV